MKAEIKNSSILGCKEIVPSRFSDNRGSLVKVFQTDFFQKNEIDFSIQEEFFTVSEKNVIRAMHFQLPPLDHAKIVFCIQGAVKDVLLDIRKGSPTYGQYQEYELNAENCNILYMPSGIAHGYRVLEGPSIVVYKTSTAFSAELDAGIAWNSCGIDWGIENPIISEKDQQLPLFEEFETPFIFKTS